MVVGTLSLTLVASCSRSEPETMKDQASIPEEASLEEKRIARTLSIAQETTSVDKSPQFKAAACSLSIAAIETTLQNVLKADQRKLLSRAREIFDRRAAAGHAEEDRLQVIEEAEQAYPTDSDRARLAAACIRDLE